MIKRYTATIVTSATIEVDIDLEVPDDLPSGDSEELDAIEYETVGAIAEAWEGLSRDMEISLFGKNEVLRITIDPGLTAMEKADFNGGLMDFPTKVVSDG